MSNAVSRMTGEDRIDYCTGCGIDLTQEGTAEDRDRTVFCRMCGEDLYFGQCDGCGTEDTPLICTDETEQCYVCRNPDKR